MRRFFLVATGFFLWCGPAHAGYVRDWVMSHGGCTPVLFDTISIKLSTIRNNDNYLDRPMRNWTDADIQDYRETIGACASRFPLAIMGTPQFSRPDLDAKIDAAVNDLREHVMQARLDQQHENMAKLADQDLAIKNMRRQREVDLAQAEVDRTLAQRAQDMAAAEHPQLEAAQAQAAEAKRKRLKAEAVLSNMRTQAQAADAERNADQNRSDTIHAQREADLAADAQNREWEDLPDVCLRIDSHTFEGLNLGASFKQADIALGCHGHQRLAAGGYGAADETAYEWSADNGDRVVAVFMNGRLQSKVR